MVVRFSYLSYKSEQDPSAEKCKNIDKIRFKATKVEEMNLQDAYTILELKPGVTIDEVKKTHKELIKDWHPDKHENNKLKRNFAEGVTQDINAAKDYLVEHLSKSQTIGQTAVSPQDDATIQNHFVNFMKEVGFKNPQLNTSLEDLYYIYKHWCHDKGRDPFSLNHLRNSLIAQGFIIFTYNNENLFPQEYIAGFSINAKWGRIIIAYKEAMEMEPDFYYEEDSSYRDNLEMDDDDDMSEEVF